MVRIKNPKSKGSRFERIVKKLLQADDTEIIRSPASLGSADLILIRKTGTPGVSRVQLIQCKYLKKYMSASESIRLIDDAYRIGATAWLAYREKPRGKIMIIQLSH